MDGSNISVGSKIGDFYLQDFLKWFFVDLPGRSSVEVLGRFPLVTTGEISEKTSQ